MSRLLLHPITPLAGFSLAAAVLLCANTLAGAALAPEGETLFILGWGWLVLLWMDADARRLRCVPCFDFGLLAGVMFPLSTLWYCFWSRGWRGVFVVLVLLGLYVGPWIVAAMVWLMKWGDR